MLLLLKYDLTWKKDISPQALTNPTTKQQQKKKENMTVKRTESIICTEGFRTTKDSRWDGWTLERRTRGKNVRKSARKLSIANSSRGTKKMTISKKNAHFPKLILGKRETIQLFLDQGSAQRSDFTSRRFTRQELVFKTSRTFVKWLSCQNFRMFSSSTFYI